METIAPYLVGLFGLLFAIGGVVKGVIDKAELRMDLANFSLHDCEEEVKRLNIELAQWRSLALQYAPASASIHISGDLVGGNVSKQDEITKR